MVVKLQSALPEDVQKYIPKDMLNKIAPDKGQQQEEDDNGAGNDTAPSDDAPAQPAAPAAPQTNN
jgi:membrane protein required for colicin V production